VSALSDMYLLNSTQMQDTAAEDSDLLEWYGDFGMALPTPAQEPSVSKPKDTAVTKPTAADAAVATTRDSDTEQQSIDAKPVADASGFLAKVKQQTAVSKPAVTAAATASASDQRKAATSDDTAAKAISATETAKADTQSKQQQQQTVRSQQLPNSEVTSHTASASSSVSSSKSGTPSNSENVTRNDDASTKELQPVQSKAEQEVAAAVVAAKQQADKRQVRFNFNIYICISSELVCFNQFRKQRSVTVSALGFDSMR
jgi:hypothetical protein